MTFILTSQSTKYRGKSKIISDTTKQTFFIYFSYSSDQLRQKLQSQVKAQFRYDQKNIFVFICRIFQMIIDMSNNTIG